MDDQLIGLSGAKELEKMLVQMGPKVAKAAGTVGVRKAALMTKRALQQASPHRTGTLKKEWQIKKLRSRWGGEITYVVRLKARYYYELLEFTGKKRPGRYNPFAERALDSVAARVAQTIVDETRNAIAQEAGKVYARSLRYGR